MRKTNDNITAGQMVGCSAIVEKRVWVASDGTEFREKSDALAYEEIMQNPHYKKLKEKVEQLERSVEHLQHDLLMERSKNPFRDVQINRPPYQGGPFYNRVEGGPNA